MPAISSKKLRQRGVALLLGTVGLVVVIPMVGLSVDVGILYAVKTRLQSSVDGASLAAARALVLGSTTSAQASSAQQNAVNWFYANFPNGNWATSGTVMSTSTVQVFDDPNNANVRNVTVTASTRVPTYFMKWFNFNSTNITAVGNASRRDVVVMLVLDRSGSMNVSSSCGDMVTAAKNFTGQFANGRDRVGLVSFSDNAYLHSAPTTNFQSVLGYSNASGNGTGELDSIVCQGGTSTAQGMAVAYNELYKTNLPGAMNVVMIETDGLPNTLTMNWWDSTNTVAGIASSGNCKDSNNKTKSSGGFATKASLPNWTAGLAMGSGSYYADIPAGIVGAVASADPGQGSFNFFTMLQYWTTTKSGAFNSTSYLSSTTAPGCTFDNSHTPTSLSSDLAWLPDTDVYGNLLDEGSRNFITPVTRSGGRIVANSWTVYHNGVLNATDDVAYKIRTNATLPAYVMAIGLGGNSADPPDYVLMQRMANDPNGDNFNSPALYQDCSLESNCTNYSTQPQGMFLFSTDKTVLGQAFLSISSQILRLSH